MQPINECFENVKKDYLKFLNKEKIYKKSMSIHIKNLKKIYIPIAFWINSKYKKKGKTLLLGLSASQGSGKTTVATILSIILKIFFKRNICIISIDDFYKTLSERSKMAKQKHFLPAHLRHLFGHENRVRHRGKKRKKWPNKNPPINPPPLHFLRFLARSADPAGPGANLLVQFWPPPLYKNPCPGARREGGSC